MKKIFLLLFLASCSLYNKEESSDEVESLSRDVLKAKEGIEIQILPVPKAPDSVLSKTPQR